MQSMSLLGHTANMSKSYLDGEEREMEWRKKVTKMRERLKSRLDENTIDGKRDDNLFHGMKLVSSTTMFGNFTEICYCEETQEYLVIDPPSNMLRFSVQAKLIQPSYPLSGTMLFTKLLWCQKAKVLIGYVPNDDMIWLMTSFCMLYQVIRNEFRITDIFYEPMTNEIVVAGPNKVTRFPLANKESTMNPWKTMAYIDSEYGALWKLECMSLIPASTSMTRLAGSYMTTIYVLPLEPLKEKEDIVPVMFLARNPAATEAAITALLFHDTSQWIITGDEQGNVMGWDLELHCIMSCPGGHKGYVQKIVVHPSICGFITCGEDNVLQIWSCNLRGKVS
ncbi:uncharacterized protein LOC124295588 [Neodiprion lecontei]|uniref:Uncharacterized protein LOC124295588 n=1 Tax=Neodiprion lecontei TaxID=441921 RepID=A0ABM3GNZ1_NEOLC|nr:uncharacterized protein LOC124223726 [Neodiprion pinetum]XP_046601980.1 uncharacterized protein LOC124295588 [Neodiprion lecontei]